NGAPASEPEAVRPRGRVFAGGDASPSHRAVDVRSLGPGPDRTRSTGRGDRTGLAFGRRLEHQPGRLDLPGPVFCSLDGLPRRRRPGALSAPRIAVVAAGFPTGTQPFGNLRVGAAPGPAVERTGCDPVGDGRGGEPS